MKTSRMMAATAALCCCALTSLSAQSLSRVQILALQQQLRDDGCGTVHATGRMDAATRRAVEQCKSKYNVSGGAAELLTAMNIGFGAGDNTPTVAGARQGMQSTGVGGAVGAPAQGQGQGQSQGQQGQQSKGQGGQTPPATTPDSTVRSDSAQRTPPVMPDSTTRRDTTTPRDSMRTPADSGAQTTPPRQ